MHYDEVRFRDYYVDRLPIFYVGDLNASDDGPSTTKCTRPYLILFVIYLNIMYLQDNTVRGAIPPILHLEGAGIGNSSVSPSARFECCARQHSVHVNIFDQPTQERVPGTLLGSTAKPPRPTESIFQFDCQPLPSMVSANRRYARGHNF